MGNLLSNKLFCLLIHLFKSLVSILAFLNDCTHFLVRNITFSINYLIRSVGI